MTHNPATAQLINKFRTHKPTNRGSDIVDGTHVFAIIDYSFRPTDDHGTIIGVDMEVVQSNVMPAGMKVGDAFFVSKSDQNGGTYEVERAMKFTNALVGEPNPLNVDTFADQSEKLAVPTQPGRGLLIKCVAITSEKTYGKRSEKRGQKKMVQDRHYEHFADQSNQAAIRAQLDQKYPITATVAPPPQQTPPAYPGVPHAAYGQAPQGYAYPPQMPPAGFPAVPTGVNPYGALPPTPPAAPPQPAYQWPPTPPPGWPPGVPYPPR